MQKIEVVVRITKDHCPPQEQTIFEWFDLMRNPTDALSRPDLEINLEHHRVFKHGTEVDGTASGQTVYKGADL